MGEEGRGGERMGEEGRGRERKREKRGKEGRGEERRKETLPRASACARVCACAFCYMLMY